MTQDAGTASASNTGSTPAAAPPSDSMNDFFGVISSGETPADAQPTEAAPAPAAAVADTNTVAAPVAPPVAPPPPEKFQFAGIEFESREKAEHALKTFRGSHRALEAARQSERLARLENQQLATRLEAMEAQLRGSSQPPAKTDAPKGDAGKDGPPTEIDWELFATLREKFGPDHAQRWLHATTQRLIQDQLNQAVATARAQIAEEYAPVQETHAYQQRVMQAAGLIQELLTYHFEDGRQAYPELTDPKAAAEIRSIWNSMDLDEDDLLTKQGLALAISHYRDRRAQAALRVSPGSNNQPNPAPAPPPPAAPASAVASAHDSMPVRPNSLSVEDQRKADIRNAPVAVAADW